jgi:signal transduction histidine kinase
MRKALLVACLYLLAVILLYYLGSFGPGLLYLLGLTVFSSLIFPLPVAMWTLAINTAICLFFAFIVHFHWLSTPLSSAYTLGSWIAVSSNLILLSIVTVAALHLLFSGLEQTIIQEGQLQKQLHQKHQHLEKTLQAMEEKNQELEQFAYIASHDLQEPLQTISSLVERLDKHHKGDLSTQVQLYLSFLSESANRMRDLLTGLLDYSRIGKAGQPEPVNCQLLLEEVLLELNAAIEESRARIVAQPLPSLKAYPVELKQLLHNLISNAIKFHTQGTPPLVTIQAEEQDQQWLFAVIDNGIGIAEPFQQKIFVIFQRLHVRSRYLGTGVGLAHAKKIVELHGGKLWVESKPDQGSTFYFTIPK